MKKILILSTFMFCMLSTSAQMYKLSFDLTFRTSDSTVLDLALAGGLNQPQFSNLDFNGDGIQDLFVFDRTGGKKLVFIADTAGGMHYFYDPSFEELVPGASTQFMELIDLNQDGLPDLWFFQISGGKRGPSVEIWLNTSNNGQLEFTFLKVLKAYNWHPTPGLDTSSISQFVGNYPDIVDINGDGDLDYIVNTDYVATSLTYYMNVSDDRGWDPEDADYVIVDRCLGNVAEEFGEIIIHAPCSYARRYKKHAGVKTVTFFDNDGDGDMDCFLGSSEKVSNPVYYLENGKNDLSMSIDTFISIDTTYFSSAIEALIPVVSAFHLVDINNDGIKDLIVATHETNSSDYSIRQIENVVSFINEGTSGVPDFQYQSNEFLVGNMVDHGAHTAPALVDIDGDGDLDLFLGSNANHFVTRDSADQLFYYENIGDKNKAEFILRDTDYIGLSAEGIGFSKPEFADIDNDQDYDLFIGNVKGTILYFENTGDASNPSFTKQTAVYAGIDVGEYSTPVFFDLDGDAILDLLIGKYDGSIVYYRNTGTRNNASFTIANSELGGIRINDTIPQILQNSNGQWVDSFVLRSVGYASLDVAQRGLGNYVLIAGGYEGKMRVYNIPDDLADPFEQADSIMYSSKLNKFYLKDWGERVHFAAGDLNNDSTDEVIIGNSRGGISYVLGIKDSTLVSVNLPQLFSFALFPNPTSGMLFIELQLPAKQVIYEITDITGKQVQNGQFTAGQAIQVDPFLSNGVYFVQLIAGDLYYLPQKFVLSR